MCTNKHFSTLFQVTSTLTFAAACASAGITVLIDNDLNSCAQNHCVQFETSTALAFISWFAALPSFLFNFWSLASRWHDTAQQDVFSWCVFRCIVTDFSSSFLFWVWNQLSSNPILGNWELFCRRRPYSFCCTMKLSGRLCCMIEEISDVECIIMICWLNCKNYIV